MVKEKRFSYILEQLHLNKSVDFSELSKTLQVSEDTIRRDIDALAANGLLSKVRGGAIPRSAHPLTFADRSGYSNTDKEIIALKAQSLIKNGQTIFMDGGTSVYTLTTLLPTDIQLTVITNNTSIIPALARYKGINSIILGGRYLKETETLIGLQAIKHAEQFQADLYFMGICALDIDKGITSTFMEEAELKQAMLSCSNQTVVLSSLDKLGTFEPYRVAPMESVHYMVTEVDIAHEALLPYRKLGIKIL